MKKVSHKSRPVTAGHKRKGTINVHGKRSATSKQGGLVKSKAKKSYAQMHKKVFGLS